MREELEHRPIWLICIGLACGYGAALFPALGALMLLPLAVIRSMKAWGLLLAAFLYGLVLWPFVVQKGVVERTSFSGRVVVAGVAKVYEDGYVATVSAPQGSYRMSWQGEEYTLGDVLKVEGTLRPLQEGMERYALPEGVAARLKAESIEKVSSGSPLFGLGGQWRRSFIDAIGRSMGPFEGNVALALCFNVDSGLPDELRRDLQRTGTIHIISASGLHVLIYAVALLGVLGLMPIPRSWQIALLIGILLVYATAAGFRPPIVRSVVMASVLLMAFAVRREPDFFNALGIALLGYLVFSPASILDIGMQLSFVTVGALALWGSPTLVQEGSAFRDLLRARMLDVAKGSLIATLASGPLVAYHFGQISVISILANVAIAGLIAPLLIVTMAGAALGTVIPGLGHVLLAWFATPLIDALVAIVQSLSALPFAAVDVPEFSPLWLIPYYLAWLAAWRRRERAA